MVHGTFGAIAMMVLEMVLFISRAMRIEGTYENKKNGTAIATRSSICSSNSPRPGLNHLGTGLLAGKPHDKGGSSMAAPVPTYHTAPVGGAWRGSNSSGDYMGHAKED